ncbi:MAG: hypothetical protein A3G33_00565 [Omnitrophica bacterium RIFCSPLOWO2_12_FULL_44_17]|uniref:Uncharacterized protein n=1 Tax=Candidatus Danuiimicrobium aquiferis TaxID=1801832 RepID=A0A1G1L0Z5_9BACT|nr:MAG: hypothetical protein A3B72_05535 [Omnitrophica bacterium RIFCSPHIGHO2_02_FULL_45_28]OGW98812.1 MAG: hypothetical protein A3G33_00565 [Omnitrophica bacterium RIFCSPLOWO2_12_FULL_44_17]OGX02674.1 MAG: hypothetical protein A3J12_06745 [Omnitrophica bacterium RIFCSPLOWO2_02_FULL_44_11]
METKDFLSRFRRNTLNKVISEILTILFLFGYTPFTFAAENIELAPQNIPEKNIVENNVSLTSAVQEATDQPVTAIDFLMEDSQALSPATSEEQVAPQTESTRAAEIPSVSVPEEVSAPPLIVDGQPYDQALIRVH